MSVEFGEMTEQQKTELRVAVKTAKDAVESGYWDLADRLHTVWESSLFIEWGYDSFPAYCDGDLDYTPRTAQYLVGIADYFGKMEPDIRQWAQSIGWTKAKELVKRVTPENFVEWKAKIAGKSVAQIQALLREDAESKKSVSPSEKAEKPVRMSFALMGDQIETVNQALERCKADANSDKDGHALTLICTDFLAQGDTDLASRLSVIEKTFGVRIIAVKELPDGVCFPYGESTLDALGVEDEDEDEDEDESDNGEPDFDGMTVAMLKMFAKERGLELAKGAKKGDIIAALQSV